MWPFPPLFASGKGHMGQISNGNYGPAWVTSGWRSTAMQTAVRMITTGVMLALLAGIAIKLKIFGGSP